MRIRSVVLLVLLLVGSSLNAQVVISPQIPSPGVFTKPQLWNLSVVNTTGRSLSARLQMTITEANTSQLVLSAVTRHFQVPGGVSQLTHTDVLPVVYKDANPSYQVDNSPNGFLPVGVFNICYSLIYQDNDAVETLADECQLLEVESLSPPQLVLPADSEKVTSSYPMFSWTPPMPYAFFSNLSYELLVVEVAPYQTAAEAVQINVPVWRKAGVYATQYQYPQALPALDTGKLYAWRITASNNTMPVAFSEVWSFRVDQPRQEATAAARRGAYLLLSAVDNNSAALVQGRLMLVFDNRENDRQLQLSIVEIGKGDGSPEQLANAVLPLHAGKNYLQYDLEANARLKVNAYYRLEAIAGGKKQYLTFQYRRP